MTKSAALLLACAGLLAWPSSARGQEAGAVLTWDDCVALALRKNPDLASSRRGVEAGEASYKGSFNGIMPQLSLSDGYNETGGTRGGGKSWQAQAAAGIDIFNFSNIAAIRSSKAALGQARAGLRLSAAQVRLALRQAFLQLLFSQENIETSRKIKELRERSSRLVTLRYNSGRESKGNMMRAQAQALQAGTDYELSSLDLRAAQKALDRQLGLDDFRAFTATGALAAGELPQEPAADSPLLSRRPDIAVQEAAVKAARAALDQSRSPLWPSFSASYARTRSGPTNFDSSQSGWSLGGILSYPIFGGGPTATYYGISAAQRNIEKAREDLRAVRAQALVDLDDSWTNLASAAAQVKVATALLVAARQRNTEADIRYDSGLLSYDNWEIISSDRISQERQTLAAQLSAASAQAEWERAAGLGLGE
ncbi:MAG: TolC family protein [Elusimicrobia bacterium]|nr:TolC family protein [Elusimicrobiota bacterium]